MISGRVRLLGRPLTVPAFRRLWSAQLVSEVGDWSARLALSVLLYLRTGSPAVTGLVVTVSLLPWLSAGLGGGSWSVLTWSGPPRLWWWSFRCPVPVLLAVVFCAGLATPPFEAARAAMRPEVLPAGLFPSAVALSSVTQDLSAAVGYLTGGVLVSAFGAPAALLCNAGSFVVSALLLLGLPPAPPPRPPGSGGGLRAGARALAGDPWIVRAVVLATAAMLAATALSAMSAPLVLGLLGGAPGLVGVSVAVAAVVSIAATAAVPPQNSPPLLLRWAGGYALAGGGGVVGCFTAIVLGHRGSGSSWPATQLWGCCSP